MPRHELLDAVGKVWQSTEAAAANRLQAHDRVKP